jgi:DNA-binding LytR/AlgR family response regulator
MDLTALIVDDELLARQELHYLLGEIGGVRVVAECGNGIDAVDLIRLHRPDLVFLDVQMPGLDGFAVLKQLLDQRVNPPQVVFATAYDQYAVRAFEVNATDYLLKPFDSKRLAKAVEKATARLAGAADAGSDAKLDALLRLVEERAQGPRAPTGKVVVRAQNRLLLVDQSEICFASIDDGSIHVVTASVEGRSNCRTLEELSDQLNPELFWRAHRSFIVSLQHIREVVPWFNSSYQLRMDDRKQTEIPVSRSQTRRLRELFNL